MGLKLITPPEPVVTLEEAKAQLDVDFNDHDEMIEGMIAAAIGSLDGPYGHLDRALNPQTWDLYRDSFPMCHEKGIRLPIPPLISVDSVNYIDPDSATETELSATEYEIDTAGVPYGWVVPKADGWPFPLETINAVRVRFTAGYELSDDSPSGSTVPAAIKQAILLIVRDLYDTRGTFVIGSTVNPINHAVDRLIAQYRVVTV